MLWVLTSVLMQVAFLLSATELKTARKAYSKRVHSILRRAQPWVNLAGLIVLALILLLEGSQFSRHPRWQLDIFSLVFGNTWLLLAALDWRRQRRQREFEPDYRDEQCFELEEDGLFRGTAGSPKVKVPWTKISRFTETDEFFLLASPWPWGIEKPEKPSLIKKQDKPVLYILPKRAFASGDIERFRDLLQRKLSVWAKNPSLKADPILTH
jgi:hypothetical protein